MMCVQVCVCMGGWVLRADGRPPEGRHPLATPPTTHTGHTHQLRNQSFVHPPTPIYGSRTDNTAWHTFLCSLYAHTTRHAAGFFWQCWRALIPSPPPLPFRPCTPLSLSMLQRMFLCWRWWRRVDLAQLMRRALSCGELPELQGFEHFRDAALKECGGACRGGQLGMMMEEQVRWALEQRGGEGGQGGERGEGGGGREAGENGGRGGQGVKRG